MVATTLISIKFLAGGWACAAFLSSADQLEVSGQAKSVSHSALQGLYKDNHSANAQESYDNAEHGTSDVADSDEEARGLNGFFRQVAELVEGAHLSTAFLEPSSSEGATHIHEQFLSKGDLLDARTKYEIKNELIDEVKVLLENKTQDPYLRDLVKKVHMFGYSSQLAHDFVISLMQRRENAWLTSRTTPAEVLEFLLDFVPKKSKEDFIKSNLCSPWLTYGARYTKEYGATFEEWFVTPRNVLFETNELANCLLNLLRVLQMHKDPQQFFDVVPKMLSFVEDAWLMSRMTPGDVMQLLLEFVPGQTRDAFFASNLFYSWIKYGAQFTQRYEPEFEDWGMSSSIELFDKEDLANHLHDMMKKLQMHQDSQRYINILLPSMLSFVDFIWEAYLITPARVLEFLLECAPDMSKDDFIASDLSSAWLAYGARYEFDREATIEDWIGSPETSFFSLDDLTTRLPDLMSTLYVNEYSAYFIDVVLVQMFSFVKDAWLTSGKTPDEVLCFLTKFRHNQTQNSFIASGLCNPMLTYFVQYMRLYGYTDEIRLRSIPLFLQYFVGFRSRAEFREFMKRVSQFPDGKAIVAALRAL